jgi:hypothetical protein
MAGVEGVIGLKPEKWLKSAGSVSKKGRAFRVGQMPAGRSRAGKQLPTSPLDLANALR